MGKRSAWLVAGVLLFVGFLVLSGLRLTELGTQLQASRQQIETLTTHNQVLTSELTALQEEQHAVDERLGSLRKQLALTGTELERARQTLKELSLRDTELRTERDRLTSQVSTLQAAREEAVAKARRLAEDNTELSRTIGRLRGRMAFLDRDVQQLRTELATLQTSPQVPTGYVSAPDPSVTATASAAPPATAVSSIDTVELPPIIVRKEQTAMVPPRQGRVVEVNTKHAFIVVDQGSDDGVQPGMWFDVVRGGKTIGEATVVRVRPTFAACDIRETSQGPMQVGDLAVLNQ